MGVSTDICAFGDLTHTSETLIDVSATLLEARFVYFEDLDKTPLTERGTLEVPYLKMARFLHLRENLDDLKGQVPSIEPSTFNFDLTRTQGGFEF